MTERRSEFTIEPLKQAAETLADAIRQPKNDYLRDAVVQRFEYTFELSWKALRRYLDTYSGIREYNLKDIFREAAKQGLIDRPEDWFGYLQARNETSHTYNRETAERTYQSAVAFSKDVQALIGQLETRTRSPLLP